MINAFHRRPYDLIGLDHVKYFQINETMSWKGIPGKFRRRVQRYYECLWLVHGAAMNEADLNNPMEWLAELPSALRVDINTCARAAPREPTRPRPKPRAAAAPTASDRSPRGARARRPALSPVRAAARSTAA